VPGQEFVPATDYLGNGLLHLDRQLAFPKSVAAVASVNIPSGVAPTSPVHGDVWTTAAGLFVRVGANTVGPLAAASSVATVLAMQGIAGFLGWSFDPSPPVMAGSVVVAGTMTGTKVHVPNDCTVTNLNLYISGTAGGGLTAGQCYAALYTTGGALLGVTADQSTNWQTTGNKVMPLAGGPVALAAGFYDVAWWANGTTPPGFLRGQSSSIVNVGTSATVSRFWTADAALTTTAPATRATKVASAIAWWAGLN
jgi:hypothetical protein